MSFRTSLQLLLAGILAVSLAACDQSSQKIDFDSGNNLTVNGPSLTIPNFDSAATGEYMIRAFSVDKEYTWEVQNGTLEGTRRDGEVAVVSTSTPGLVVTAKTTIDGEEYSGSAGGSDYPTVASQAQKYDQLGTFGSLLGATGLAGPLTSGDAPNDWTAFAPTNAAIVGALDADGNGEIGDEELPAPGILTQILQYHVLSNFLRAGDISSQSETTLLHPEEQLSLDGSAGTVEASNGTVNLETVDIATNDGVVHSIDGVLLPVSLVSINDQTVGRDSEAEVDTVDVEGTYLSGGGFVVLHQGGPGGDIIGASDYLEAGFHGNAGSIEITLDSQLSSDTTTVVAMSHRDTDGDQAFNFDPDQGTDVPYFRGGDSANPPVINDANVVLPANQ